MLVTMTRKLCPLIIIFIATVGCGKKITEAGSQNSKSTESQNPEPSLVLSLETNNGNKSFYTVPQNAVFRTLPSKLRIREGVLTGKTVSVTYNVDPEDRDYFEFKCKYVPHSAKELIINNCENFYGEDLGDITPLPTPIDGGKLIKMELGGAYASGISVDAYFIVDWK